MCVCHSANARTNILCVKTNKNASKGYTACILRSVLRMDESPTVATFSQLNLSSLTYKGILTEACESGQTDKLAGPIYWPMLA